MQAQIEKLQSDLAAANRALKTSRQALKESELDLAECRAKLAELPELLADRVRLEFMVRNTVRVEQTGFTFKAIDVYSNVLGVHHTAYGAIDAVMERSK